MLVSNTSTLVLLAKVTCLEKAMEILPDMEIPSQVRKEALGTGESFDARLIRKLIEEQQIAVVPVPRLAPITAEFHLDAGEAAAYTLYNRKRHRAIMTDDGELMKLCRLEKIPFICALAVVVRLYERKKISLEEALQKLERLYMVGRYAKEIYEHFRKEVG